MTRYDDVLNICKEQNISLKTIQGSETNYAAIKRMCENGTDFLINWCLVLSDFYSPLEFYAFEYNESYYIFR